MTVQDFMGKVATLFDNSNTSSDKAAFKTTSLKEFATGKSVSLHKDDLRTNDGTPFSAYGLKIDNVIAQFSSQLNHEDDALRLDEFKGKKPEEIYAYLKANAADFDIIHKYDKATNSFIYRSNGEPVLSIVKHNVFGTDTMTETW